MKLTIIRGLPGSGKTTMANKIAGEGDAVVAADDFFSMSGEYRFSPNKLGEAHSWCQEEARKALTEGRDVVVHNTFSTRWEMEPYLKMGEEVGADIEVLNLFDSGLSDAELVERCVHGVGIYSMQRMRERWEHDWKNGNPLPPWQR